MNLLFFCLTGSQKTNKTVHTQNDNRKKLILRECVWRRVRACVCVVLGGEASTTEIVAWIAMYLTGYSDYLIGFHEPLFATL